MALPKLSLSILTRTVIILLWITAIFGILYFPTFSTDKERKAKSQTLDLFCWPEMFLPDVLKIFERETGIKVVCHYYTTNEEMIVKLKASQGKNYDLIIPSDYAVKRLIKYALVKRLDHSKLNFLAHLNSALVEQSDDPSLTYSLPYQWEIFGLGVDKNQFDGDLSKLTWDHIFNPDKINYKIAMPYDLVEAISLATYYLFGPVSTLNLKQKARLMALLKTQKKWVETYSALRSDYFLTTKNCSLAVSLSSHIFRSAAYHPHIGFTVPADWSMISVENMCIPIGSKKDALVYRFLNFLYQPEMLARDCNAFLVFPATTNVKPYLKAPLFFTDFLEKCEQSDRPLYFAETVLPEKEARDLWIKIRH